MKTKLIKAMSGNEAAAYISYAFTEVAAIYPITPSTDMAEMVDEWSSKGKKNLFDMPVKVIEMQSEGGAAGTMHGSLQMGVLTTSYTSSQGLLLKIPNMYKMAGQLLPGVIHVAARSLATHALSIFGDHQDVMAVRQTGFAILATSSVQEVMDLAGVAHLSAIKSSVPFLHFFDGFRTSHENNTIEVLDYEFLKSLLDEESLADFRKRSLNPSRPVIRGTSQTEDTYFQAKVAQQVYYPQVIKDVSYYMEKVSEKTGRHYAPFVYYGAKNAKNIIIAMGSVTETIKETINYLNSKGESVGLVTVHLYRPFSIEHLHQVIPEGVEKIAVLEKTLEPGALGNPLYMDVLSSYANTLKRPQIIGGTCGLSSKDTTPAMILAVYENLKSEMKHQFTLGIDDDVTNTSLRYDKNLTIPKSMTKEYLFYGMGSDGTVGASNNITSIIGDNSSAYTQSYAVYDSKKSGGITRVHVRVSDTPIRSTYLVTTPDFISISQDFYLEKLDIFSQIKKNAKVLINTAKTLDQLMNDIPTRYRKEMYEKELEIYLIDATSLAKEIGLGNRTNTLMQSAFFKINEDVMLYDEAYKHMMENVAQTYGYLGGEVVAKNREAIKLGALDLSKHHVDSRWIEENQPLPVSKRPLLEKTSFVEKISEVINRLDGTSLPVSAFQDYLDGSMPLGTAGHEKRGTANNVPRWNSEKCIQCNKCVFACPHAVIRAFLVDEEEKRKAPTSSQLIKARGKGLDSLEYTMQISALDCTECGLCVDVCPVPTKALEMVPIKEELANGSQERADFFFNEVSYKDMGTDNARTVSFKEPLFEFSGACAGCGETPYIKALTQLFGSEMVIANATGCTSIISASFPSSAYTTNIEGFGPAWANSLFEDNAEFGFGMKIAQETMKERIVKLMKESLPTVSKEIKKQFEKWLDNNNSSKSSKEVYDTLVPLLEKEKSPLLKELLSLKDYLYKVSQWIIGGDGWAYDIGFSGIDHVLSNNLNVNILVLDTEVYSNTGGQASKSGHLGSVAKFSSGGKKTAKKDLAMIAMSYENAYVAQISHGYSPDQVIKAFKEAESFDGPSIILAYAPCIEHKIVKGMSQTFAQAKQAVEVGYWPTFRYDPSLLKSDLNPFQMDSKKPDWDKYHDYLMSEGRYRQLMMNSPEDANELLEQNLKDSKRRYLSYQRIVHN